MRDPFRTNAKQQLIREAQIGLTAVAIVLALFLYVAFHKITGRGRHLTDRVGNAPIAEPVWPSVNSGDNSPRSPKTGLDASSSSQLDSFKPLAPSSRNQVTEISGSRTKPTTPEETKLAGRNGDSVSSLLGGSFGTREIAANKPANPISDRSDDAGPHASSAATSGPPTESSATELVAAKTFSKSETKPNSFELGSLDVNDLRAANSSMPQADTLNANLAEKKPDVQLTSAVSNEMESASQNDFEPIQTKMVKEEIPTPLHPGLPEPSVNESGDGQTFADGSRSVSADDASFNDFEPAAGNNDSFPNDLPTSSAKPQDTSVLEKAHDRWPGDSNKSFPPSHSKPNSPTAELPTLRSPRPIPDVPVEQPKRLPGSIQKDIAKALVPDESKTSVTTRIQPTGTPADTMPRPATYMVREGDSYWSISADVYNDGRFFRALYEHNRFVTPSFELVPGTNLATPVKSDLIKLWPDHCPREESDLTDKVNGVSSDADSRIYFTKRGDTLFEIAGQKLGQASRYLEIYRLNQARLDSKVNHLSPLPAGVRLVLPPQ